jgi:hypothetical protein
MLGSWGSSGARTTVAVLSRVWHTFAKLALPILALALVALQGDGFDPADLTPLPGQDHPSARSLIASHAQPDGSSRW